MAISQNCSEFRIFFSHKRCSLLRSCFLSFLWSVMFNVHSLVFPLFILKLPPQTFPSSSCDLLGHYKSNHPGFLLSDFLARFRFGCADVSLKSSQLSPLPLQVSWFPSQRSGGTAVCRLQVECRRLLI